MDKIELLKHCDEKLLTKVFDGTDILNGQFSELCVDDILNNDKGIAIIRQAMKVFYTFEKIGVGNLIHNGHAVTFDELIKEYDDKELSKIPTYWKNAEENGDTPIYDLGSIENEPKLPKFNASIGEQGQPCIEKLENGQRAEQKEYTVIDFDNAKDQARKLNRNVEE
jgi:hypothetical protein